MNEVTTTSDSGLMAVRVLITQLGQLARELAVEHLQGVRVLQAEGDAPQMFEIFK